ncbi:HBL339Wp [Eremothecium sinecaudum]|uniref:HBL339Wp n=1 Tax=Eremothecium sinecaudum TaxID=45286 RepID=A0A109UW32_9SACH|nr:HBL339Wp [Eremothecium sinecaudum]AMD18563.1 HBL339Wp [Eremothecium sinecaudum]
MASSKKILMLHGMAQDGEYFKAKTKRVRNLLEPFGYEFFYPTSPVLTTTVDIPDNIGENKIKTMSGVYTWVLYDYLKKEHYLPQESVEFIREYVLRNGPFEGVIGFSQGASFGGYLVTDFNGILGLTEQQQPPLKFFINFAGFKFYPEKYQEQYRKNPIQIPSLHVQGDLDTITESASVRDLFESCVQGSRTFLKHGGGHIVPSYNRFLAKVVVWLQAVNPQGS